MDLSGAVPRAMEDMEFNPVTASYAVRQDKVHRTELFEDYLDGIKNEFRDLVFICEDEQVSYHSELVSTISPVIREFVQKAKSLESGTFVKSQVEMFVTLAGVDSDVLEMVMSSVYEKQPMMFSTTDQVEIGKLFKMLGIDGKAFSLENHQKFGAVRQPPLNKFKRKIPSEDFNVQKRINSRNENHVGYNPGMPNHVSENRTEEIVKEHKSITMTKVGASQETGIEQSLANQSLSNQSLSNLPSSISILPSTMSKIPTTENKIQNFLPHLTITPLNQENLGRNMNGEESHLENSEEYMDQEPIFQDNVDSEEFRQNQSIGAEEFGNNQSMEAEDFGQNQSTAGPEMSAHTESQGLKCPIAYCPHTGKIFRVRSEIIMHIAHEHYKEQLLELHPWSRGGSCQLCVEQQKPRIYASNNKKSFIMHVGVTHEVVMELLPQELRDVLTAMGMGTKPKKGRKSRKNSVQATEEVPRSFLESGDISFENNSFSNTFEDNDADQVYDDYNYEEGSDNFQYQEAPNTYVEPYPSKEEVQDPYQEVPNLYESPYPESSKSFENPEPFETQVSEPYGGSIETIQKASNIQESNDQPASSFLTSSVLGSTGVSQFNQGIPKKSEGHHLTCHLCTMRSFPKKDDLLFHLTFSHFSKDILRLHPYVENKECALCEEDPVAATSMSSHLRHTGVGHGEVLQFLTPDVAEQIREGEPKSSTPTEPKETVANEPKANDITEPKDALVGELKSLATEPDIIVKAEVKEEVEEPKPEVANNVPEKPIEATSVQCTLCPNKVRMYSKRSDFLKHLSLGHYGRSILQVHPYQEGETCSVCQETSSKVFVPTKKEIHVCHVGVLHGKVFDYLSEDLLELVKSLPTLKKAPAAVVKSPIKDEKPDSSLILPPGPADATLQEEVVA